MRGLLRDAPLEMLREVSNLNLNFSETLFGAFERFRRGPHSTAQLRLLLFVVPFAAGFWTFLWFVCFCYLADTWRRTTYDNPTLGESGVEAAIVFSFFSIGTFVRIHHSPSYSIGNNCPRHHMQSGAFT